MSQYDSWEGKVDGRYSVAILQILSIFLLMLFSPDVIPRKMLSNAMTYFLIIYAIGFAISAHLTEKRWRDSFVLYTWIGFLVLGGLIVYFYPSFVNFESKTPAEVTQSLRIFSLFWLGTFAILLGFRPFRYLRTIALLVIAYVLYNNMAYMVQLNLPAPFWHIQGVGTERDSFFIANGLKSLVMVWLFMTISPTTFEVLSRR